MGARKPPKKPEKKSLFASLFAGFGGGKKKEDPKKRPASGSGKKTAAGAPKKGASLAKKPKVQAPPPDEDFLTNDDPLAGIENDLLGAIDGDMFSGVDFAAPEPPQPMHVEHRVPPMQPAPQPQQAAAPAQGSSLFGPDGVDNALDSLFDSFEVGGGAPAAPPAPPQPAPQPMMQQAPAPQPMMQQAPAPQPQAPRPQPAPPAAQQPPQQDGLVSIGKLLVDQNTLKRIIDNAEKRGTGLYTTTRIISNAKGADLDAILGQIDQCGGVAGSLIVGRDGLVIASTLPTNFDKELVGAIASSMQTNLDVQCKKMKLGTARQVILDTEGGVVLLIALEVGVLVVMSQSLMSLDLTGVLSVIAGIAEKV